MTKSTIFPRHHIRFPHFTIFFCSILLQSRIINNSLFYILYISTRLVKNETEDRKKEKRKNPLMGLASSFKIEKWLSSALHRSRHKLEVFNCTFPIPFSLPMSLLIDWKYHKIVSPLPSHVCVVINFPHCLSIKSSRPGIILVGSWMLRNWGLMQQFIGNEAEMMLKRKAVYIMVENENSNWNCVQIFIHDCI